MVRVGAALLGAVWLGCAMALVWVPTSACLGSALLLTWALASLAPPKSR